MYYLNALGNLGYTYRTRPLRAYGGSCNVQMPMVQRGEPLLYWSLPLETLLFGTIMCVMLNRVSMFLFRTLLDPVCTM